MDGVRSLALRWALIKQLFWVHVHVLVVLLHCFHRQLNTDTQTVNFSYTEINPNTLGKQ